MAKFELYRDSLGDYRWWLKVDEQIVATGGQPYATPAAARSDIEALRGCANTPVVDTTGDSE